MALIVDTGPLFAALYTRDRDHEACAELLTGADDLLVPTPVLVESEWLVTSRLGPAAFDVVYDDLLSGGLKPVDLSRPQWRRVRELCRQYADLPLGLVDASVVAVAEALGSDVVATLDRRHFAVVRPAHVEALTLVP
ncbi:MAG: type II toxin-antitoxin system VapC family toxin [Kineosporiaceae bacterium]